MSSRRLKSRAKGIEDVRSLARAYTDSAIKTLAGIMSSPDAPQGARVTAAEALLNRGWGKPDQTTNVNVRKHVADLTDAELANIASRGGNRASDPQDGAEELPSVH